MLHYVREYGTKTSLSTFHLFRSTRRSRFFDDNKLIDEFLLNLLFHNDSFFKTVFVNDAGPYMI